MVLVSQEKESDQSRNLKMDDLGLVNLTPSKGKLSHQIYVIDIKNQSLQ